MEFSKDIIFNDVLGQEGIYCEIKCFDNESLIIYVINKYQYLFAE